MNILITTQHGGVAGATYSIFYLAKGMLNKGNKVVLGIPFGTLLHRFAMDAGIRCEEVPFLSKLDFGSWKKIRKIVNEEQIQIIYAQESRDRYVAILSRLFFRMRVKLVLARRQKVVDNNFFKRWFYSSLADKTVVVSEGLKSHMQSLGFSGERLKVIFNGFNKYENPRLNDNNHHLKEKYSIHPDDVIVGCVSRPKRQEDLFAVLELLPTNYRLMLVGITQEQVDDFFPYVNRLAFGSRIIICGILEDKNELIAHYQLMNVHVLSSDMDGFGLVSLEAMSVGIPVIGSNFGGIPDIIVHEESGYIYELGEVGTLQDQILEITTNLNLRNKFIRNAKRQLNKFSIDNMVENYHSFFESLLTENHLS